MELFDYLQSAKKSLFRFEALQEYLVEGEDLENDSYMKEWWDFIQEKTRDGIVMERVRLIREPLTEYTKKELVVHKKSKSCGDDIRIIDGNNFEKLEIAEKDFWLIDDKIYLDMKYSNTGEYLGFDVHNNDIEPYQKAKELLLENSEAL